MLEYTHRSTVTTTEKRTVLVPTEWSMFTAAGNRRMTKIAKSAYDEINSIKEKKGVIGSNNVRRILQKMLRKWHRLGNTKSMGEAGDTAVREAIGDWHDELWRATVGGYPEPPWLENNDEAASDVYKARQKNNK